MRRIAALLAALLVASLLAGATPVAASHQGEADCSFPLTVTDDAGTEVTLEAPAEAVVAGSPSAAQTFWELGARDAVVGMPVNQYTTYLDGAETRTHVLTENGVNYDVETIVDLEADLVVLPGQVSDDTVARLRDENQTVYRSPFGESFEDVYAKAALYGHVVGDCEAGADTASETRRAVETVRQAVADRDRPDVLYYFYGNTAGNGTFVNDVLEAAGGSNIAAQAGVEGYGEISDEGIRERNPSWVVTHRDDDAFDPDREPFPNTTAGRNDRVLTVDANLVSQPAPRVVEPLRAMAEAFHPEAFREPTATATATRTATATETSEDDGAGLGFGAGAGVAAAALLAALLLARRR